MVALVFTALGEFLARYSEPILQAGRFFWLEFRIGPHMKHFPMRGLLRYNVTNYRVWRVHA